MHLSASDKSNRLPKRLPVGTTYVVEGQGGEGGHLRVSSRYLVLPGGRRINLADDFGRNFAVPASPRARRHRRGANGTRNQGKAATGKVKKIIGAAGTARQQHR
jgi:hypothetical protein